MRSDPRPYIVKPNAKGEGHGIFVASTIGELDKHDLTGHVAQPLLTNPYLIQGKKFDFRSVPVCKPDILTPDIEMSRYIPAQQESKHNGFGITVQL